MSQILILFASTTRNTEQIANLLMERLDKVRFSITMKEIGFDDIEIHELQKFDGILFGTYTYDDGDLPFECEDFHDKLKNVDLTGKVVGVFGSGDTSYSDFCHAVDLMKEQFEQTNANVIEHTVKVDLFPEDKKDLASIMTLANLFTAALSFPFLAKKTENDT